MRVTNTKFKGLKIIHQKRFGDNRGSLRETYRKKIIKWDELIFDYATISQKNVLRGFHFNYKFPQVKFVTVLKGKILDYVIDLRKKSPTFGKSFSIILSEQNCKSLYIPEGFAHAYYCFSKFNLVYYKLSDYYAPNYEDGILWNDKSLKLKWPKKKIIISKRDTKWKTFEKFKKNYKGL
jgi:dTDP-4-dehydrorhamnose 3,5-epimerase|tara:strand:+ start:2575 stop:3111 length:537 start_codon:yes stop_codon:yes gene_type:complete